MNARKALMEQLATEAALIDGIRTVYSTYRPPQACEAFPCLSMFDDGDGGQNETPGIHTRTITSTVLWFLYAPSPSAVGERQALLDEWRARLITGLAGPAVYAHGGYALTTDLGEWDPLSIQAAGPLAEAVLTLRYERLETWGGEIP